MRSNDKENEQEKMNKKMMKKKTMRKKEIKNTKTLHVGKSQVHQTFLS